VVGMLLTLMPLALPHAPFTAVAANEAEQLAGDPPFWPGQAQFHGPEPLTVGVPRVLQRLAAGLLLTVVPFALPHAPFTGVAASDAEQLAGDPPFWPAQLHVHGPVPLTVGVAPVAVQRFVAGAVATVVPFELPQAPFTGAL